MKTAAGFRRPLAFQAEALCSGKKRSQGRLAAAGRVAAAHVRSRAGALADEQGPGDPFQGEAVLGRADPEFPEAETGALAQSAAGLEQLALEEYGPAQGIAGLEHPGVEGRQTAAAQDPAVGEHGVGVDRVRALFQGRQAGFQVVGEQPVPRREKEQAAPRGLGRSGIGQDRGALPGRFQEQEFQAGQDGAPAQQPGGEGLLLPGTRHEHLHVGQTRTLADQGAHQGVEQAVVAVHGQDHGHVGLALHGFPFLGMTRCSAPPLAPIRALRPSYRPDPAGNLGLALKFLSGKPREIV